MRGFKKYTSSLRATIHQLGKSPMHDWYFAIFCFVVGIILAVAVDAYLFISLSTDEESTTNTNVSSITVSAKDVRTAIEAIEKDDANSAVIPDIVKADPSL